MSDVHRVVDTGLEHDPVWMTREEIVKHVLDEHPKLEEIDPTWQANPYLSHAALHNSESEHVTFYRAFGTEKDAEPHLKVNETPKHQSAWNECHNGVHSIDVKTYGDEPQSVFVDITGIDKQAVIDTWFRIVQSEWWHKEWWGGE